MPYSEKKKEWIKNNQDKMRQYRQKYFDKDPEKELKRGRIKHWRERGIICDYDAIYEIYINTHNCDYCGKKFKTSKDRQLDHDHETGAVRGILCISCNTRDVLN
jgi:hypothetical protein